MSSKSRGPFERVPKGDLPKLVRCDRCGRRCRSGAGWNVNLHQGMITGFLCPDCQTPEENAEAEINDATWIYGQDGLGRIIGRPKGI
jgi:hypothetical protein